MTDEQLAAIQARYQAIEFFAQAEKRPFDLVKAGRKVDLRVLNDLSYSERTFIYDFFLAAPDDIPALLDEVERLRVALDRITGLYLHDANAQDDEITLRQMYETALAALSRQPIEDNVERARRAGRPN